MNNSTLGFYEECLKNFIPDRTSKILVCGAGESDSILFDKLCYENVTMSGMDFRKEVIGKFEQTKQNAESLTFNDNDFDYCVMHASIHHTRLPHKVITELYRVASKGVLFIEARDSFLMRTAIKLGLTEEYEVKGNYPGAGVNGTDIPNYIYRWTEREVIKTIKCFEPCYEHSIYFKYGSNFPDKDGKSLLKRILLNFINPVYKLSTVLFKKQQNLFAVFIIKQSNQSKLKPWLKLDTLKNMITVDRDYIKDKFFNNL